MQLTLRAKLVSIVALTAFAFGAMLLVYGWLGIRQAQNVADMEGRLIPKLELGPKLESQFEHLRQSMQDAVAAQDPKALDESIQLKNTFIATVSSSGAALSAADSAQLRHAITAYHEAAYAVSRRLMRGETGESLVDALAAMQAQQRSTDELVRRAARLDRRELADSFQAVRGGTTAATRYAVGIGLSSLFVVLVLSTWIGRSVLGPLGSFSHGVARFATGDFREPIPVTTNDELGKLTRETNQMAESLRRSDWLRTGLAKLSGELRGDLTPDEVAERTLRLLAKRVGAVAGALYVEDADCLRLAATFAGAADGEARATIRRGQGLAGEALLSEDITVVEALPEGFLKIRSGTGEAEPRSLILVPLRRSDRALGLLELALFEPASDEARELLRAAREIVGIALEVATSRARLEELLDRSQKQTELLAAQEEELRAGNRELVDQQEELQRANQELESQRKALSVQNVELEAARESLVQKATELGRVSNYKSQFLANMSHELRTPLNSMLLLSHLLGENEGKHLTDKQVEYAKTIHTAGKDLLGLINQVLDLAKIEAGRQDADLGVVPLRELVAHVERLFSVAAPNKGLELEVTVDAGLPETLTTDRSRVERILVNLLGNALKFTERGRVSLRVARPKKDDERIPHGLDAKSCIAFAVSDTGIGIPAAAQERIFAPFEQADSRADRRYGGTGLGLAIARESAVLLGGDLVLSSREGHGSTFTCYLPDRAPESLASLPAASASAGTIEDDRDQLHDGDDYLLVVEDDRVFAERLLELIRARRFKAVVATTGEEALGLALAKRPRGIILDVKLPDMDGWAVMERLRRSNLTRSVPVHFISGANTPERALALGAVGYLMKPATAQELIGAIRMLLRKPDASQDRVLLIEDNAIEGGSLAELLGRGGLATRHVVNAKDALEALASEAFSCVILDLGLPDMDGLGLLEVMGKRPELHRPPVIVHTGRSLTRDEIRRIEAYAAALVLKDGHSTERLVDEVRLFVQHVAEDAPKPAALSAQTSLLPDLSLEGARILLADDDMRTVYALSALLRGKGADVVVAETGREALELLEVHDEVNVVLMDVMMPGMDGYEALRRMRSDSRFAHLPAIALTAKAMKGERERCLEAGASDYLAKPVDPGRLLTTLSGLLGKNHADVSQRS